MIGAPFGGHAINLAAITLAMCAGPDADPDPQRRWIAGVANGLIYFVLGPLAGLATVLLAASPVVLIECIAGLAMLATLGASLRAATDDDTLRDPAIVDVRRVGLGHHRVRDHRAVLGPGRRAAAARRA